MNGTGRMPGKKKKKSIKKKLQHALEGGQK